jgi:hypothetical protein
LALTEENLYESVKLSLERFVDDFRVDHFPTATQINWDDHANIQELPEADVIGLAGIGLAEDEHKKYQITFGVLASTWGDKGLVRLTKAVSAMFGRIAPENKIVVYTESPDGLSAVPKSWMVTALPRAVTPVQKAEVRAVQGVECHVLLDPGATSYLR